LIIDPRGVSQKSAGFSDQNKTGLYAKFTPRQRPVLTFSADRNTHTQDGSAWYHGDFGRRHRIFSSMAGGREPD
jgi:hypothetical protein